MTHKESEVQQRSVRWFRLAYPEYANLFFAVPNGGRRGRIEASILKAEGVTKGVADTLLLVPSKGFHGLCVEFKRTDWSYTADGQEVAHKSHQSPEQRLWQKEVTAQGYRYEVCASFGEFCNVIEDYLGKRI